MLKFHACLPEFYGGGKYLLTEIHKILSNSILYSINKQFQHSFNKAVLMLSHFHVYHKNC